MGNLPAVFVQLLLHPTLQNLWHLCQLGSQGSKVCQLLYVTEQKNEIIRETLGLGKREQADRSSLLRLTSFTHSSRATARLQSRMFAVRSKMFQVQDLCIQGVRHWRRMTCYSLMYHRVCKYCTNMAVVRIRMTVITLCIGLTWVMLGIIRNVDVLEYVTYGYTSEMSLKTCQP